MLIDLKCSLAQPNFTLPIQFHINFLVFRILVRNNCLFIAALYFVPIFQIPVALPIRFIIFELSLVVWAIGENPFALH